MIPLSLSLEGIYSYQTRQTIDFSNLIETGLFGIFGSVGSGKSSILEAITFALYGETERLHSRDNRAYNMMNLKSKRSLIDFEFLNFENKKFKATREFKRNSKNFDDVKASSQFYEWKDEAWQPLSQYNVQEIVGLSYANFKRTIIIPQGQFKEFLELGSADRTKMMKEIFNLQRFDLGDKIKSFYAVNKSQLDQLQGQLMSFEDINEEQIAAQKTILLNETTNYKILTEEFNLIDRKYQSLKSLKSDFEILEQKAENFKSLEDKKTDFELLNKKTKNYEQLFQVFKPLLSEKLRVETQINLKVKNRQEQEEIFNTITKDFQKVLVELKDILPKYKNLDSSKLEEHDLNLIIKMCQHQLDLENLKVRSENGLKKVAASEQEETAAKLKIEKLNNEVKNLKKTRLSSDLMHEVGNWFSTSKNINESLNNQTEKIIDCKSNISLISEELTILKVDLLKFKENFTENRQALETERKLLSEQINMLNVQQKLAHFASELHEGKNCPLCGSKDHPDILHSEDFNNEIGKLQKDIDQLENKKLNLQNEFTKVEKLLEKKKIFEDQLEKEDAHCEGIKLKYKAHLETFKWDQFSAENENNFITQRQKSSETEIKIESLENEISEQLKVADLLRKDFDKFNILLQEIKMLENEKQTKFKTDQEALKILDFKNYKDLKLTDISDSLEKIAKSNQEIEDHYKQLNEQKQVLEPKLAAQQSLVSQLKVQIGELENEQTNLTNSIKKSLLEQNIDNLAEVEKILHQEINIDENRRKIQVFHIEFETLKNSISELKSKLKDFTFNAEEYSEIENLFTSKKSQLKIANDSVVKLEAEITRILKELKKKETLLKDLEKVEKRADNLRVMTNLFKAAGFVQYASSIYLRQLCDQANIRFHRMTRNQLSLQLNDSNDFEIIDFLNEGRKRSVKTLSGGQAFQVSLCLALALAESVQTNAQAERNFFFIDEGFGTQDPDSVNIVFETLQSLQKENRIVGIISHVEELKEKMPVALNIVKDEMRGSLIGFN